MEPDVSISPVSKQKPREAVPKAERIACPSLCPACALLFRDSSVSMINAMSAPYERSRYVTRAGGRPPTQFAGCDGQKCSRLVDSPKNPTRPCLIFWRHSLQQQPLGGPDIILSPGLGRSASISAFVKKTKYHSERISLYRQRYSASSIPIGQLWIVGKPPTSSKLGHPGTV